ncbi:ABC transporter ATP-binding protein [uncultured Cohaesibacter sp.]|uniref:ABC transporter ATP-binding protein n=1 Tax=uncultured Cohaesibacter sp. TaxID=1002546 RepID=UPI00292CC8D2|nr:ABC transporter ATP-binding protein [uncultured Cohaesibacter sp.]
MIELSHLDLSFGEGSSAQQVLSDVTFNVLDGEVFGLVGESGSGKSTVLRCIAGLYDHWTGTITVDGHPVDKNLGKEHYRKVQMVFQDPYGSLHPKRSINSALIAPLQIHKIGDEDKRINEVLDQVGLPRSSRFRYPHQLSGGQRQRVAIARALILEPQLMLLDEPTSALDVSVQAEILNLLVQIRKERHLSYVMVSHDLAVITHLCDRLAVMRQGCIEEVLSKEALLTGKMKVDYTKTLYEASRSYDRAMANQLETA